MVRRLLPIVIVTALLTGCDMSSNPALGPYEQVHVISEREADADVLSLLSDALEIPFRTFQEETLFVLLPRPVRKLDEVKNRKNLLFPVDLSERGRVERIATQVLGDERIRRAKNSAEAKLFFIDDPWAVGQTAAFLLGANRKILLEGAKKEGDRIRSGFLGANRKRILRFLLFRGENISLSRKIYERYGWTIRMPAPFVEDEQFLDKRFFTMKMDQPGRIVSVYWEEGHAEMPPDDAILEIRRRIGWDFADEDEVDSASVRVFHAPFQGHDAVRIEGIWQNEKYTIGGPFRSIAFLEPGKSRLFLIDYAVYAPGFSKKYYLWELESVVETFSFDPPPEKTS